MAYNPYFPTNYQPMYYPNSVQHQPLVQPQAPAPQPNNGLNWVQGEAGAKSYLVAPNTTVLLLDSESESFYIKSSDASGMPLPLRVFDYKERKSPDSEAKIPQTDNSSAYVTKREFEAFKGQIEGFLNAPIAKEANNNE